MVSSPASLFLAYPPPLPAQVPLTVGLFLQVSQTGIPCKDVCLTMKTLSEGMDATRKYIVEHTACREDVHCAGLGARGTEISWRALLQEVCLAALCPGLEWKPGIWFRLELKDASQEASS